MFRSTLILDHMSVLLSWVSKEERTFLRECGGYVRDPRYPVVRTRRDDRDDQDAEGQGPKCQAFQNV